jgi:hypothetical protein
MHVHASLRTPHSAAPPPDNSATSSLDAPHEGYFGQVFDFHGEIALKDLILLEKFPKKS